MNTTYDELCKAAQMLPLDGLRYQARAILAELEGVK